MKIAASIISAFVAGSITASAFAPHNVVLQAVSARSLDVPSSHAIRAAASSALNSMSDELDIPCEDECAMSSYPSLPESVHPGVLSGQAMVDLVSVNKPTAFLAPAHSYLFCLTFDLLYRLKSV